MNHKNYVELKKEWLGCKNKPIGTTLADCLKKQAFAVKSPVKVGGYPRVAILLIGYCLHVFQGGKKNKNYGH